MIALETSSRAGCEARAARPALESSRSPSHPAWHGSTRLTDVVRTTDFVATSSRNDGSLVPRPTRVRRSVRLDRRGKGSHGCTVRCRTRAGRAGCLAASVLRGGGRRRLRGARAPPRSSCRSSRSPARSRTRPTCKATDISATDKQLIISNWPAYIDPTKQEDLDAAGLRAADRDHGRLHRRRQRQRRVLRQGAQPARRLRADRARHDDADRLDGRPDDRPRLDPAAGRASRSPTSTRT